MYTFKVFIADDINEDRKIALRKHVVFVKPNNATELMQSPFSCLEKMTYRNYFLHFVVYILKISSFVILICNILAQATERLLRTSKYIL